jgi:hypothetical protein
MSDVERRVDELAALYSGRAFADAVKAYAGTLDGPERGELERVLLERAASFDQAVMERVDARGWFRRQWDKASGGR